MVEVNFYDDVAEELLRFAVIIARVEEKWVFCRHRERTTYELPGGHRETGETILEAARRELQEETGAEAFDIQPVCVYSVRGRTRVQESEDSEVFGMLYLAEIFSFGELHSEIAEVRITPDLVRDWTYPQIQPLLIAEAARRGKLQQRRFL